MFENRLDAGQQLAAELTGMRFEHPVVLGLPRGGVPVAAEVARVLDAPLDVIVVRKLGIPYQPEVAMGAIGEGGARVLDRRLIEAAYVSDQQIAAVEAAERETLDRRVRTLRVIRPRVNLKGRTAIIVDDGLATGATATVACQIARELGAIRVVLAVPVAPAEAIASFPAADDVIAVLVPTPFRAVGLHYRDFAPTSDDEVATILRDEADRERRESEQVVPPESGVAQ